MIPSPDEEPGRPPAGAPAAIDVSRNHILSRIPTDELSILMEHAEEVDFPIRHLLFDQGDTIDRVYFPLGSMLSLVIVLKSGPMIEALTVGKEGFSGPPLLNGVKRSRYRGVCQIQGRFVSFDAEKFSAILEDLPDLERRLRRYAQFANDVVSQSAACNSIHTIEQRCARWLLITGDAIGSHEFSLTQEFLSQMLAVRRPGVNVAMRALGRRELISHRYGKVTILDAAGLREAACECYGTITARAAELLT
jgi:CRP-like cAMP-binding protein